jgi:hypothetical protein
MLRLPRASWFKSASKGWERISVLGRPWRAKEVPAGQCLMTGDQQ